MQIVAQIIWCFISFLGIGMVIKEPVKKYSFGYSDIIATIIVFGLYAMGGFFHEMAWPQIAIITMTGIGLMIEYIKDGQTNRRSVYVTLFGLLINAILLYFGGFFTR